MASANVSCRSSYCGATDSRRTNRGCRLAQRGLAGKPTGRFRKPMREQLDRAADAGTYGQRWQVETVNGMRQRNLGSACRARTARSRAGELLLRCVTHNIMILHGNEP